MINATKLGKAMSGAGAVSKPINAATSAPATLNTIEVDLWSAVESIMNVNKRLDDLFGRLLGVDHGEDRGLMPSPSGHIPNLQDATWRILNELGEAHVRLTALEEYQ